MVSHTVLIALVPVVLIASLAMPAGIGGGLLYVPLLLFMGVTHETRTAAAMAQPLIVGATLAAIVYNVAWQRRHPGKRLMQPDLALAAILPCLAGTLVGTLLNQALPGAVIHLLLLVVLLSSIRNTLVNAMAMWRRENLSIASAAPGQSSEAKASVVGTASSSSSGSAAATPAANAIAAADASIMVDWWAPGWDEDTPHSAYSMFPTPDHDGQPSLRGMRQRSVSSSGRSAVTSSGGAPPEISGASLPALSASCCSGETSQMRVWLLLLIAWGVLVASLVLRGGRGSASVVGVRMCSWEYWCITALAFCVLLATGLAVRRPEVNPLVCFVVGTLGSVVGIGGGIMLNPMLLGAGIEPLVATATVTVMIAMVSSNATINFVLAGAIPVVPTLLLTAGTFVGSLCGKSVVGWLVAKTGRNSILVFMLVAFMIVSTLVVSAQSVEAAIYDIARGENPLTELRTPCQ